MVIQHILFPFDFSDRCCGAIPFVEAMANHFGAKVTLISVAQPEWLTGPGDVPPPVVVDPDEARRELRIRLDGALGARFANLQVERTATLRP